MLPKNSKTMFLLILDTPIELREPAFKENENSLTFKNQFSKLV